jgi:hypothetical protein
MLLEIQTLLFAGFLVSMVILLFNLVKDNQKIMERRTRAFEDMALAMSKIVSILEEEMKEE